MMLEPLLAHKVDQLKVRVYPNRQAMGHAAGVDIAAQIRQLQGRQLKVRMIFAAAPSQNETLTTLSAAPDIDWSRIIAFHMDEYLGLGEDAPQRFGTFLRRHLFDRVHPGQVHLINSSNAPAEECRRYSDLLNQAPIDIVCLGIGENGHIAFNDPPVANFSDPQTIKVVELDDDCRQQQVNDGCFPNFAAVPTHALSLTIPTLMAGHHLFCSVPGSTKRKAVEATLNAPVSTACPSTILRTHADCTLYVDTDSYGGPLHA
jgi:glucosamine-6-phosphate deaminase